MPKPQFSADVLEKAEREAGRIEPARLTPAATASADDPRVDLDWVPPSLVPLFGTSAYETLSEEQRRRYNHYYALQLSEEFLWLEQNAIVPPLEVLSRRRDLTPSMRAVIEAFVRDERSHSEAIANLLQQARPDLYADRHDVLFRPPSWVRLLVAAMARFPTLLTGWCLFVGALEEQTITIARLYRDAETDVDPLFARVHTLHAQDEARHCQYDSLIADGLIRNRDSPAEGLAGAILAAAFRAYYDVDWGFVGPIRQLVIDFPDLRPQASSLVAAAVAARTGAYEERLLDAQTAPITKRNAERYPMLARAIHGLALPRRKRNLLDGFGRRS